MSSNEKDKTYDFLGLPIELRREIYKCYFEDEMHISKSGRLSVDTDGRMGYRLHDRALLFVHPFITSECIDLIEVHVDSPTADGKPCPSDLLSYQVLAGIQTPLRYKLLCGKMRLQLHRWYLIPAFAQARDLLQSCNEVEIAVELGRKERKSSR
jgi:hypothetical protein